MHNKYLQGAGGVEGEGIGVDEESDSVDGNESSDPEPWVSPDAPDPLPEPASPFTTISLRTVSVITRAGGGYHIYHHEGRYFEKYSPKAKPEGNFFQNIFPRDDKCDIH